VTTKKIYLFKFTSNFFNAGMKKEVLMEW
jgi:hypothetical protein